MKFSEYIQSYPVMLLLVTILLPGCNRQKINLDSAEIIEENALIFEAVFTTDEIADAYIEYWEKGNRESRYSELSSSGSDHRIRLYNLLAETTYQYRVCIRKKENIKHGDVFEFTTGTLPAGLPEFEMITDSLDFNGYILLKAYLNPGSLMLIDRQARIVWYHLYDSAVVRPFEFTHDRNVLSLADSSVIEEISLEGELLRRIDTRDSGIDKLHHELFKSREGNYTGLTYTQHSFDLSSMGGQKMDTVHGDGMVVIDSTGRKIWEWDIFDHADPLQDDSIMNWRHDWAHANSIAIDPQGDYLVSMRNLSQVWKVSATQGEVIWKIGKNGDFSLEGTEWFIRQHDAHISPEGHLLMFDNGNAQRGYSRVLALELDESNKKARPVIDIRLDQEGTTFRMGSARMIDDRYILVCSPKKLLTLAIMDREGSTVWKVSARKDSYKAFYLPRERIENEKWF